MRPPIECHARAASRADNHGKNRLRSRCRAIYRFWKPPDSWRHLPAALPAATARLSLYRMAGSLSQVELAFFAHAGVGRNRTWNAHTLFCVALVACSAISTNVAIVSIVCRNHHAARADDGGTTAPASPNAITAWCRLNRMVYTHGTLLIFFNINISVETDKLTQMQ